VMVRGIVFGLCALFTLSIFVAMLVSIWSTRDRGERQLRPSQSLAGELVWAAIPCLMVVAAAIPTGVAILTSSSDVPREPRAVPMPACQASAEPSAEAQGVARRLPRARVVSR